MRTLNRDNISEFRYRREQLPERIRCLEEIASGRNISFLPLITGKDGMISQNKQTALVRKMLEALTQKHLRKVQHEMEEAEKKAGTQA